MQDCTSKPQSAPHQLTWVQPPLTGQLPPDTHRHLQRLWCARDSRSARRFQVQSDGLVVFLQRLWCARDSRIAWWFSGVSMTSASASCCSFRGCGVQGTADAPDVRTCRQADIKRKQLKRLETQDRRCPPCTLPRIMLACAGSWAGVEGWSAVQRAAQPCSRGCGQGIVQQQQGRLHMAAAKHQGSDPRQCQACPSLPLAPGPQGTHLIGSYQAGHKGNSQGSRRVCRTFMQWIHHTLERYTISQSSGHLAHAGAPLWGPETWSRWKRGAARARPPP